MAKSKEITVVVARLINTGNYENTQFSISETLELSDTDDVPKLRNKKIQELTEFINEKEKAYKKALKKKSK